jgi:putative transposase
MPRIARIKAPEYIYHVMCRSISELLLFRDADDKNYYLDLLKKNKERYCCKVYAYCLLDNHIHLHLDPQGFDLSKFMHSVNVAYVIYYNRKYKRHGHILQGRFESRVISSDSYNLAVSAYIHNNPKDIEGYWDKVQEYPFSSMGFYSGEKKDYRNLVDTSFVLSLMNVTDTDTAVKKYMEFVGRHLDTGNVKSIMRCIAQNHNNITHDERKVIIREAKPGQVAELIVKHLKLPSADFLQLRYRRSAGKARAFLVFVQRSLCGFSYKKICENIGNMSMAGLSRLCGEGFRLFMEDKGYRVLFQEIVNSCRV